MTSVLAPFELFLVRSQTLLSLAQVNDWEAFESLMAERQQELPSLGDSQLLIAITQAGKVDEAKALIHAIQQIDQQIITAAEASKTEIGTQLRQSLKATKAVGAYKDLG